MVPTQVRVFSSVYDWSTGSPSDRRLEVAVRRKLIPSPKHSRDEQIQSMVLELYCRKAGEREKIKRERLVMTKRREGGREREKRS